METIKQFEKHREMGHKNHQTNDIFSMRNSSNFMALAQL